MLFIEIVHIYLEEYIYTYNGNMDCIYADDTVLNQANKKDLFIMQI